MRKSGTGDSEFISQSFVTGVNNSIPSILGCHKGGTSAYKRTLFVIAISFQFFLSCHQRHLQFHDGNLPYQCDYQGCKKAFKSKYDLKCHYRLHTGEKPYKCQEPGCGMAFRIPCQFTMHKRAHTGQYMGTPKKEEKHCENISKNMAQIRDMSLTLGDSITANAIGASMLFKFYVTLYVFTQHFYITVYMSNHCSF